MEEIVPKNPMVFSWHLNHPNQWKAHVKSQKIRQISNFFLCNSRMAKVRLQSIETAHIFVVVVEVVPVCKNHQEGNHETIFELMAYS